MSAAQLARLVVDPELIPHLDSLLTEPKDCQLMATYALNAQNLEGAYTRLLRIVKTGSTDAGLIALTGVLRARSTGLLSDVELSDALRLRLENEFTVSHPDALCHRSYEELVSMLESAERDLRPLLIELLSLKAATDPRAREKLILLASGKEANDRVLAISALAQIGDDTAADLLVRAPEP